MMKRLTLPALAIVFFSLSLLSTGCDKPEEKAPAPAKTQTMKEQIPAVVEKIEEQAEHVVEEVKEKTEHAVEEAKKITAETVEAAKEAGKAMKETGAEMMDKAAEEVNELTQKINQNKAPGETTVQQELEKKTLELKKPVNTRLIEGC